MCAYFWLLAILILSVALMLKPLIRKRKKKIRVVRGEEYGLSILINTGLKMKRGKVVSQACHAVSGVIASFKDNEEVLNTWKLCGEAKIVLKATVGDIACVVKNAKENGVRTYKVYDAGRTQVLPGSNTAVAVGPAPRSVLTLLTGHLSLY